MNLRLLLHLLLLVALTRWVSGSPYAESSSRDIQSLNGKWDYIVDLYDTGYLDYRGQPYDSHPQPTGGFFLDAEPSSPSELIEYRFSTSDTLMVPGDWNHQEERLQYYEGTIWHRKQFSILKKRSDRAYQLRFGGANYRADVYLNGLKIGHHVGGFTPFQFDITEALREGENTLVVRVNNRREANAVPTLNTDWWNYGGITRDVDLVEHDTTYIQDYFVRYLSTPDDHIEVSVTLGGKNLDQGGRLVVASLGIDHHFTTDTQGQAKFTVPLVNPTLWSPDFPHRHRFSFSSGKDELEESIGLREIETRATEILLNGQSLFLRGICLHEENPLLGRRATTPEEARMLLGWAKELGCNYVRLAHYPHNTHMIQEAEALGLLVWAEIPVYWAIEWNNQETLNNAIRQLDEMILRDRNRASIAIWSVANETPISDARNAFLRTLIRSARNRDPSRLISAALEVRTDRTDRQLKHVDDPIAEDLDIISFNQYMGWYSGLPRDLSKIRWQIHAQKPVIVSEFGGDALQGFHGEKDVRFTEEFQDDLYQATLSMLSDIPQWRGVSPWILSDFRSPKRLLPKVQDGWNRKGLIGENGTRKRAFSTLQKFYREIGNRSSAKTSH